jgi:hypothetical protein
MVRAAETATEPCLPERPDSAMLPWARFDAAEDDGSLPVCRSWRRRCFTSDLLSATQHEAATRPPGHSSLYDVERPGTNLNQDRGLLLYDGAGVRASWT